MKILYHGQSVLVIILYSKRNDCQSYIITKKKKNPKKKLENILGLNIVMIRTTSIIILLKSRKGA